jgi:hypothetical protein
MSLLSSSSRDHRMLWDRFPELPYHAWAPWPVTPPPQLDWVDPIITVQSWLDTHVGAHYVDWTWDMWRLQSPHHNWCGVSFLHQHSVTLFLLRFGTG